MLEKDLDLLGDGVGSMCCVGMDVDQILLLLLLLVVVLLLLLVLLLALLMVLLVLLALVALLLLLELLVLLALMVVLLLESELPANVVQELGTNNIINMFEILKK